MSREPHLKISRFGSTSNSPTSTQTLKTQWQIWYSTYGAWRHTPVGSLESQEKCARHDPGKFRFGYFKNLSHNRRCCHYPRPPVLKSRSCTLYTLYKCQGLPHIRPLLYKGICIGDEHMLSTCYTLGGLGCEPIGLGRHQGCVGTLHVLIPY